MEESEEKIGNAHEQSEEFTDAPSDLPDYDKLVEEAIRGSDSAFTLLWRHFQPRMVRYLAMFTNDPEDLSSEVWIKVATSIKGFDGDSKAFRGWIYTIARNSATDLARKRKREGVTSELHDGDWMGENSTMVEVMDLIKKLPQEYAEIIMLRVVADLEVNDVAEIVGKTPGNVRVLTHRGLKQLNEMLSRG
ncbi:MAG TPA: sigma-70 family RNA polymerase sigma factor [Candidatus Paceibacterota bacterium]|nr:sigma-70 family RNA polymerase sigma factor [Candidatus Paceibacterota bacterium]